MLAQVTRFAPSKMKMLRLYVLYISVIIAADAPGRYAGGSLDLRRCHLPSDTVLCLGQDRRRAQTAQEGPRQLH